MRSAKKLVRETDDNFMQYLCEQVERAPPPSAERERGWLWIWLHGETNHCDGVEAQERGCTAHGMAASAQVLGNCAREPLRASLHAYVILHELLWRVVAPPTGCVLLCDVGTLRGWVVMVRLMSLLCVRYLYRSDDDGSEVKDGVCLSCLQ